MSPSVSSSGSADSRDVVIESASSYEEDESTVIAQKAAQAALQNNADAPGLLSAHVSRSSSSSENESVEEGSWKDTAKKVAEKAVPFIFLCGALACLIACPFVPISACIALIIAGILLTVATAYFALKSDYMKQLKAEEEAKAAAAAQKRAYLSLKTDNMKQLKAEEEAKAAAAAALKKP